LEHDFSQIPIHPPAARVIQTKLAINKPGDEYEREADRISEQVMRMPEPPLQQPGQEHERLQTKHIGSGDLGERTVPPIVHEVLGSPGRPLDPAARAFTESRFGHDFSQVRLHTDTKAAESARAVNSLAYTVGQHVVFGTGRYAPGTTEGGRLLAHELTHVVQQTGVLQRQQTPAGPVPDISSSGEYRIGEVLGGVGVATTIGSILETGGTMTAAGVFGTLSGLLLPAGAFLLGTSIAEERERQKAKLAEFKMKLVGSAMLEAVAKLRSKLASTQHGKMAHLNERGHQAVNKISQAWREKMSDEFDWKWGLWTSIPYFNPSMLAAALQPVYENWVNGNAEDLYRIFADSNMTMP